MKIPLNQKIDKEIFWTIFIDHWDSLRSVILDMSLRNMKNRFRKCLAAARKAVDIVNTGVFIAVLTFIPEMDMNFTTLPGPG